MNLKRQLSIFQILFFANQLYDQNEKFISLNKSFENPAEN